MFDSTLKASLPIRAAPLLRRARTGVHVLPPLPTILALAAAIRIFVGLSVPNIIALDEVYQYLGQAHRLVFGHGYIPWEFQVGLRSWLIPGLLAGPMALARLIDANPAFGLALIRVLLSLVSLSLVACATLWGQRFEGRRGAWITGLTAALWPDLWVMAPHPLEGALASYVLLPALYLIEPRASVASTRRIATAAALLGFAFVLRNALAPAIAVAGIGLCRTDRRRWIIGLTAGAAPVLFAGLLDWATWGTPFRSFWLNFLLNGVDHVGSVFGHEGPGFYPAALLEDWLWAVPLIALAIWRGAPRLPITALTAAAVFLIYAPLGHKEFRFLFPMIALIAPIVGIGLSRLSRQFAPLLVAAIALTSLAGMLASPLLRVELSLHVAGARAEIALAGLHPRVVGSATPFIPSNLYFGPQTRLVAIPPDHDTAGLDALIIPGGRFTPGPQYRRLACFTSLIGPVSGNGPEPPRDCAWIASGVIPLAHTQPFGNLMIFPQIARPFALHSGYQSP